MLFVFVYGTLKEGFPNYHLNRGVRVPGTFITCQRFPLFLVGERHTPCLINRAGRGEQVVGQVYRVDQAALAQMDELEQVTEPGGYQRMKITVRRPSEHRRSEVEAYLKDEEQLTSADVQLGPLAEYTLEHSARYQRRQL
ncbi:MAG: gamma-glutamylcyclotransferase [Desulfovermiculus sp.]|nr:gamma-glutamylcyclotransferase [Desulfovermiculus sp.]